MLEEWQLKVGLDDFSLQTFLSTEQEQLKWISSGLPSDYLSLQNAVIIAQVHFFYIRKIYILRMTEYLLYLFYFINRLRYAYIIIVSIV